jgi:Tetratricopeptide repeat
MRWSSAAVPALVLAVALARVPPASAADANSPSGGAARAEQLFRDARGLLDQGRYREACRLFERSLELAPSPGTLLNLGNCYEQEGNLERALSTFEHAVADAQLEKNEDKRRAWVDAASQRLDSLRVRVPVLQLMPSPTPGAVVRVDGADLAQVGGPLRINPGPHSLDVSAPGKQSFHKEVQLQVGEHVELALPILLDVPSSEVVASAAGPREQARSARPASPVPWLFVGGGGALAIAGGVTALIAKSKQQALEGGCDAGRACANPALRSTRDSGEKLATATYVLWGLGGASALVGLTWMVLEEPASESPREGKISAQVSAGCLGTGCTLLATGSF